MEIFDAGALPRGDVQPADAERKDGRRAGARRLLHESRWLRHRAVGRTAGRQDRLHRHALGASSREFRLAHCPRGAYKATMELVVAAAENDVIGRGNALPWRLPADLRHFKALTLGSTVLMGRETYES